MASRYLRTRRDPCAFVVSTAILSVLSACGTDTDSRVAATEQAIAQAAGSGGSVTGCVPVDTEDSVPDQIDEDCDGRVDEDVDATPADCPPHMHVIEGTRGDDTLRGTPGRDCILAYGGDDTIYGLGGADVVYAGPGDDKVYSGSGSSVVHAGAGNDWVDTTASLTSLVYGEAGEDTLLGGLGNDVLHGGDGNDVLKGGGGNDWLDGGGCHDLVIGGTGFDAASGGRDIDVCKAEVAVACEKTLASRVSCNDDSDCESNERCTSNSGFCVPDSAANCNACVASATDDATCDGIDDDCDGAVDEDYVPTSTLCGTGSCASTGELRCVDGQVVDSCSPGQPLPGDDATCDGVDDDCDGVVDEGFVGSEATCGLGVCSSTVSTICILGEVVSFCAIREPPSPVDTVCNGKDDDCDGAVDEEVEPVATSCGVGVCARSGTISCQDGQLVDSCQPGEPTSRRDTSCNGLDDDCNGEVDDAYVGHATRCGNGKCACRGQTSCVDGSEQDSCQADCEQPEHRRSRRRG